jgi:hypothetical protein
MGYRAVGDLKATIRELLNTFKRRFRAVGDLKATKRELLNTF